MTAMKIERSRTLAAQQIDRALARIQRARSELDSACADLSAIIGGVQIWRATGKLSDRTRDLYYRVRSFRHRRKYRLDDTNEQAILDREAASAGEQS